MKKVLGLKGCLQYYAWGGKKFIPNLLGIEAYDQPVAEYWLGAHHNDPALVVLDDSEIPLDQFIESNPAGILGQKVFKQFGRLPFLFKVLDVHQMLSIQVHPSKIEAEKGFKRENDLGISLTAPDRNYKDDNHKPEIMVALGDFWLLHGFLAKEELLQVLKRNKEFSTLTPLFLKEEYQGLYQYVMELPASESDRILRPLVDRILPLYRENKLSKASPDFWAAKSAASADLTSPLDKGIFSIYFFNILKVTKGEAIFQDAGVPHAYLEGQNIELMANSDNVLRGGLTPKHIDVPELLKHINFKETKPQVLKGSMEANGLERVYKSPAPDFELSEVSLSEENVYKVKSASVEIYILMEGKAEVKENNNSLLLKKGDSFLALAGAEFQVSTSGSGSAILYKAATP